MTCMDDSMQSKKGRGLGRGDGRSRFFASSNSRGRPRNNLEVIGADTNGYGFCKTTLCKLGLFPTTHMEGSVVKPSLTVERVAPTIFGAAMMLVAAAGLTHQQAAAADFDAEKYFKGKTITVVV